MAAAGDGPGGSFTEGQVVTVFRSRRRGETETAYLRVAQEMESAARAMPGFVDFKAFAADDGERVSLITFATPSDHEAWRDDRRHRRAQQQGRDDFYLEYSVQVGVCTHVSGWDRGSD
jgi:heme-degrading monooxygenase HmoA